MARGYPAILSLILSAPFLAGGGFLFLVQRSGVSTSTFTIPTSDLRLLGIPVLLFGFFILVIGLYVQFVAAPSEPRLQDEEEIMDIRQPSQRVAISKLIAGIPFLGMAGYLLFFTVFPYIYPTAVFLLGLYFFSSGLKTYWANSLTRFYVTTLRVIKDYRFLSQRRQEIPLMKIRAVEERRSASEMLVGLGNIQVASGGGGGSVRISIKNISNSTRFADVIRNLMG